MRLSEAMVITPYYYDYSIYRYNTSDNSSAVGNGAVSYTNEVSINLIV